MLRTTLFALAAFAGIGFLAAAPASADANHLTNADVAAVDSAPEGPTPYKVTIPEIGTGGGGTAYWIGAGFDAQGNPLERCMTNACGDDFGKTRINTGCDAPPKRPPAQSVSSESSEPPSEPSSEEQPAS